MATSTVTNRKVAPCTNKQVLTPIHVCYLEFDSLPEHFDKDVQEPLPEGKTWFDAFIEGMRFHVLPNAYVLLFREYGGGQPAWEDRIFARTNQSGELLQVTEKEIGDDPPQSVMAPNLLGFRPNEEVLYFWTLSKNCFQWFLTRCEDDWDEAYQDFEFTRFRVFDDFAYTHRLRSSATRDDNPFSLLDQDASLDDESYPGGGPSDVSGYPPTSDSDPAPAPQPSPGPWQPPAWDGLRWSLIRECLFPEKARSYQGCYPGRVIAQWLASTKSLSPNPMPAVEPYMPYLVAGSRPMHSLYLCELAYYHAMSLLQLHAEDFSVFAMANEAMERQPEDEPDKAIEDSLRKGQRQGMPYEIPPADVLAYRSYARQCAEAGVPLKVFSQAVNSAGLAFDHQMASREIEQKFGIKHPNGSCNHGAVVEYYCFYRFNNYWDFAYKAAQNHASRELFKKALEVNSREDGWIQAAEDMHLKHPALGMPNREAPPAPLLMRYFDIYSFAVKYKGWKAAFESDKKAIGDSTAQMRRAAAAFLQEDVDTNRFFVDLELHGPSDAEQRVRLGVRYLSLTTSLKINWIDTLDIEKPSFWEKWKGLFAGAGTTLDKGGTVIVAAMEDHLKRIEEMQKLFLMLGEDKKRVERCLNKLISTGRRLEAPFEKRVEGAKLHISGDGGERLAIEGTIGGKSESIEVEIFEEKTLAKKTTRTPFRRVQRHRGQPYHIDTTEVEQINKRIRPILAEEKSWPKYMGAFGSLLSLAISSREIFDELKKKSDRQTGEFALRVSKDAFQFIDSGTDALAAFCKRAGKIAGAKSSLPALLEWGKPLRLGAKAVGAGLEVYLNIKDGSKLIIVPGILPELSETSDTAQAVFAGDDFAGYVYTIKGVVLVVGSAGGVVYAGGLLIGGATFTVAVSGLVEVLAVVALVVVALDIVLWVHEGPSNCMKDLDKKLAEASDREFGHTFQQNLSATKHRTLGSLQTFVTKISPVLK